jgi:D-xylose transport system ATP-binding protein
VLRDGYLVSEYWKDNFDRSKIIEDMVGRTISNFYPKTSVEIGREVLRVEHLTIPHPLIPGKNLVEDVSFTLHAGEIVGLAGLVGSGRSEVMGAIFGEKHRNANGSVYLECNEIKSRTPLVSKQLGIGFLTENRKKTGLVASMDVAKNISLANLEKIMQNKIISEKKELSLAGAYQEKLTIRTPSLKTNVLKLSGGNQQKVVLAKWLETKPKVLLLDEPTKGIDVGAKVDIYRLMTNLAKSGVAILLVSSDMPELLAMSDRILVLAQGRLKKELHAHDASQKKIMEVIMND